MGSKSEPTELNLNDEIGREVSDEQVRDPHAHTCTVCSSRRQRHRSHAYDIHTRAVALCSVVLACSSCTLLCSTLGDRLAHYSTNFSTLTPHRRSRRAQTNRWLLLSLDLSLDPSPSMTHRSLSLSKGVGPSLDLSLSLSLSQSAAPLSLSLGPRLNLTAVAGARVTG